MTYICVAGVADEIEQTIQDLDQKIEWSHSQGEKFEQKAETLQGKESETYINAAVNFYDIERKYNIERNIYKLITKIERDYINGCCDDDDDSYEWKADIKAALSQYVK